MRTSRIAYLGPTPTLGTSGPSECAWLILEQLAASGVQLDCYLTFTDDREQLDTVARLPGTRVISVGSRWRWNRWYSRSGLTATVTGLGAQALGRRRLVNLLVKQHELVPYDVVYQFSTIESFGRRTDKRRLPPVVLHPSAHAAGELRWMYRERELSRRCEGWLRPTILMGWFFLRSRRQRRDIGRAAVVLALSEDFACNLVEDYHVKADRLRVVPNPINLEAFRPATDPSTGTPVQIAMVGRISVRKGVEQVVELSHRLADLAGSVLIRVFGDQSQWSDYRALLKDLSPEVASYEGYITRTNLLQELPTWDLLLQPAKYEPFGLTVGEALACVGFQRLSQQPSAPASPCPMSVAQRLQWATSTHSSTLYARWSRDSNHLRPARCVSKLGVRQSVCGLRLALLASWRRPCLKFPQDRWPASHRS